MLSAHSSSSAALDASSVAFPARAMMGDVDTDDVGERRRCKGRRPLLRGGSGGLAAGAEEHDASAALLVRIVVEGARRSMLLRDKGKQRSKERMSLSSLGF